MWHARQLRKWNKEAHEHWSQRYSRSISRSVLSLQTGQLFQGKFSHVGYQKSNTSSTWQQSTTKMWTPACTQGDVCSWLARGACRYFHKGVGVQRQSKKKSVERTQHRPYQTSSRGESGRGRGPCRYGANCFRKETCGFSHGSNYNQGFPPLTRRNQHFSCISLHWNSCFLTGFQHLLTTIILT